MSLVSDIVVTVVSAPFVRCGDLYTSYFRVAENLTTMVILAEVFKIGVNIQLKQTGTTLLIDSTVPPPLQPSTLIDNNLVVTGIMTIQQDVVTTAVLIPDSTGPTHSLFFYHGLLASYSFGNFFTATIKTDNPGVSLANQFKLPLVPT